MIVLKPSFVTRKDGYSLWTLGHSYAYIWQIWDKDNVVIYQSSAEQPFIRNQSARSQGRKALDDFLKGLEPDTERAGFKKRKVVNLWLP